VLSNDSFTTEWGPGPAVEKAFEADCACDLQFTTAGDGAALLARVQLEGAGSDTDVVLGLDTNLTAAAAATGLFAPHGLTVANTLPVPFADPLFLPFDWGWFAFVYDRTKLAAPPESWSFGCSDADRLDPPAPTTAECAPRLACRGPRSYRGAPRYSMCGRPAQRRRGQGNHL
jgi:thiamine transport system substrate-binding protein